MGPIQALVLGPWLRLRPRQGRAAIARWQRAQGRLVVGLARRLGGLELRVEGSIPPGSCIVVMNHQSLLDIPIAFTLLERPAPLIPARARYARVPVFGALLRLGGHPLVSPGSPDPAGRRALLRAVQSVARGEHSLVIFPEGHRGPEGGLLPFVPGGLRLAFRHAPERPVHLVLVEGLARTRTLADVALRLAGTRARVTVLGPFAIPSDPSAHEAFIASLRARLQQTLAAHRAAAGLPFHADATARL